MDYTSTLPAEVLLYVFRFARVANGVPALDAVFAERHEHWMGEEALDLYMTQFALAWISITHVCSRWRALALADTTLWTDIPNALGTEWAQEFIIRSGEQALSLNWPRSQYMKKRSGDPNLNSELKGSIVQTYHQRLRRFCSFIDRDDLTSKMLSRPWPNLEELKLKLLKDAPAITLLADHAPRLRHLGFHDSTGLNTCATFPWTAPFMKALCVLDIYFKSDIDGTSMVEFLDALNRMSGLQHLRLGSDHPTHLEMGCAYCSTDSVRLQDVPLQTLSMDCTWLMTLHILKHIRPPPSCRLSFTSEVCEDEYYDDDGEDGENIEHIWSDIYEKIREWRDGSSGAPQASPYVALKVHFSREGRVHILLSSFLVHPSKLDDDEWHKGVDGVHPDLEMSFSMPDFEYRDFDHASFFMKILVDALNVLAPRSIQMLSIDEGLGYNERDFDSYFIDHFTDPVFHNVAMLNFPSPGFVNLRCLEIVSFGNADGDEEPKLLPGLKVLDFSSYWLSRLSDSEGLKKLLDGPRTLSVYLRVSEELEHLHNGRIQDTSLRRDYNFKRDAAKTTTDIMDTLAMPGVRVVRSDADVSYAVAIEEMSGEVNKNDEGEASEMAREERGDEPDLRDGGGERGADGQRQLEEWFTVVARGRGGRGSG